MKRKYVDGDGNEHYLDVIEVDLRNGSLEDLVESALTAEEDDKIIGDKAVEIEEYLKSAIYMNTLERWYYLGKKLQFIDTLELRDETSKNQAFKRIFSDLQVDLKKNPSFKTITRYPLHMYNLSKIPKNLVFYKGMTWSRWFDILEYKRIREDLALVKKTVIKCCGLNLNSKELRQELKRLNQDLKRKKI